MVDILLRVFMLISTVAYVVLTYLVVRSLWNQNRIQKEIASMQKEAFSIQHESIKAQIFNEVVVKMMEDRAQDRHKVRHFIKQQRAEG